MNKRTCADCIHCQMCRWIDDMVKNSTCDFFKDWKELEQIPHGEWKHDQFGDFFKSVLCSNCDLRSAIEFPFIEKEGEKNVKKNRG